MPLWSNCKGKQQSESALETAKSSKDYSFPNNYAGAHL